MPSRGNSQETPPEWVHETEPPKRVPGSKPEYMHVVWGDQEECHSSETNDGGFSPVRKVETRKHKSTASANTTVMRSAEFNQHLVQIANGPSVGHGDSSDTPCYLIGEISSRMSSHSRDMSGTNSQRDRHHIVFQDDTASEETGENSGNDVDPGEPSATSGQVVHGGGPTLGSQLHGVGKCRPCMFSHTVVGCTNGAACEFCHFSHRRQKAARPCKAKRDKFKAIVERQARQAGLGVGASDGDTAGAGSGAQSSQAAFAGATAGGSGWAERALAEGEQALRQRNAKGKQLLKL